MSKISVNRAGEQSFTLVETMIALGLMVFLIAQFTGIQGGSVTASMYSRRVTQAIWLAKRIMAQVEYYSTTKNFKDLTTGSSEKERTFEDFPDYQYELEISDWKLPLLSILGQSLGGKSPIESDGTIKRDDAKSESPIESMLKQVIGEELFKIARVEVFWKEGAVRDSVSLSYLIVNQSKLDEVILTLKAVADATAPQSSPQTGSSPQPNPSPGSTPAPTGQRP